MIDRVTKEECCLCKACANVCPTNAIQFNQKQHGCFYPFINDSLCIECNLCEKVCPTFIKDSSAKGKVQAYAVKSRNENVRENSTSGGVFFEAARYVLKEGGCVAGAKLDNNFKVKHIVIEEEEDLVQLCGSKYAQSDTKDVYKLIKKQLKNGRKVLFCGCPCQIAGLSSFLGEVPQQLYLMELVCHGNVGEEVFKSYITLQEAKMHSKIKEIRFRDKTYGWHRSSVKIEFENGKKYLEPITADAYMKGFLSGIFLKESCFLCKYKDGHSGSDLTLGDFWGAEVEFPKLDDNKGLSAVIVRTEKGEKLLDKLEVDSWNVDLQTVLKYNPNIIESTNRNPRREEFFLYAIKKGYCQAINDLLWEKPLDRIKRKVRYGIKCVYYKILKKGYPLY